eukprot:scaffold32263_cov129-Isochrysis_galbana.AAC.2
MASAVSLEYPPMLIVKGTDEQHDGKPAPRSVSGSARPSALSTSSCTHNEHESAQRKQEARIPVGVNV